MITCRKMKTLEELQQWLDENFYNRDIISTSVTGTYSDKSLLFTEQNGKWRMLDHDGGTTVILEQFDTEEELVEYAYNLCMRSRWWNSHLAVSTTSAWKMSRAKGKLRNMGIHYEQNDIPNYRDGRTLYRLYVFGRDQLLTKELENEYIQF